MMKRCLLLVFFGISLFAQEVQDRLRKQALNGDKESMLKLAHEYFHGSESRRPDRTIASYWYRKAAEAGVPEGMYNYGVCLLNGYGTNRNRYEAVQWFRKAADAGVKMARLHVATITISGLPEDAKNGSPEIPPLPEYGLSLLKELAAEQFVPAELAYAQLLLQRNDPAGIGESSCRIERAAVSGFADACRLQIRRDRHETGSGGDAPASAAGVPAR